MIPRENLKDLLSSRDYGRKEKLLLCLGVEAAGPKSIAEVRELAVGAGLSEVKKWNISDILARSTGLAIRTKEGWELTSEGRRTIANLSGALGGTVAPRVASSARHHLASLPTDDTRKFVEEAIRAFEHGLYRAAVVLSWVGAAALLQDHVLTNRLPAFNAEAARRDPKWRDAKSRDDLARMREFDFLQVLETVSVIGKSTKHELEGCLRLRNGCGHPNSLKIGEARVAAHLETLVLNVFSAF